MVDIKYKVDFFPEDGIFEAGVLDLTGSNSSSKSSSKLIQITFSFFEINTLMVIKYYKTDWNEFEFLILNFSIITIRTIFKCC
ncbi:MAG: hypothetical protein KGD74_10400 [Candidatus Lokiarchaeota archaeon]|nr:hypothetical protein [Candidatus Lokiarchaeota archaeon]